MLLVLADEEYRFGVGSLLCIVHRVFAELDLDDGPSWWHLSAECAQGTLTHHGGWHLRELYVISSAVRPVRTRRSP
jgi:hypothetical protein